MIFILMLMLNIFITFSLVNVLYKYILSLRLLIESNLLLNDNDFLVSIVNDVIITNNNSKYNIKHFIYLIIIIIFYRSKLLNIINTYTYIYIYSK